MNSQWKVLITRYLSSKITIKMQNEMTSPCLWLGSSPVTSMGKESSCKLFIKSAVKYWYGCSLISASETATRKHSLTFSRNFKRAINAHLVQLTAFVVRVGHQARFLQALGGDDLVLLFPIFVVRRDAVVREPFQHFHHGYVTQFLRDVQRSQTILVRQLQTFSECSSLRSFWITNGFFAFSQILWHASENFYFYLSFSFFNNLYYWRESWKYFSSFKRRNVKKTWLQKFFTFFNFNCLISGLI